MIKDFMLSKHFGFYEMTTTNNAEMLVKNRTAGEEFIATLHELAQLMDGVRDYVGKPVVIHSAFRCPELNGAIPGSSIKSQHMKAQACDFTALDSETDVDDLFNSVIEYLVSKTIDFGQLINESAQRGYGRVKWVHLSLGQPYRQADKCGQVLSMVDGVYAMLKKVNA